MVEEYLSNKTRSGDVGYDETILVATMLSATDRLSEGKFTEDITKTVRGPRTTIDMYNLYTWEHGDKLYGTHAKSNGAMQRYRNDINKAWGREKDYKKNLIFVDTTRPIGEQLKNLK